MFSWDQARDVGRRCNISRGAVFLSWIASCRAAGWAGADVAPRKRRWTPLPWPSPSSRVLCDTSASHVAGDVAPPATSSWQSLVRKHPQHPRHPPSTRRDTPCVQGDHRRYTRGQTRYRPGGPLHPLPHLHPRGPWSGGCRWSELVDEITGRWRSRRRRMRGGGDLCRGVHPAASCPSTGVAASNGWRIIQ